MKRRVRRVIIIIVASLFAFFGAWVVSYPDEGDRKNIKYVLWKHGLYKLDLDLATDVMVGDPDRTKLVIGKTETQLRKKFGYLLPPIEGSYYLRDCTSDPSVNQSYPYGPSPWKDKSKKRLFIRQSPLMVIFDGDKVSELWVLKGC